LAATSRIRPGQINCRLYDTLSSFLNPIDVKKVLTNLVKVAPIRP